MAKIQTVFAEKVLGFRGQETIEVTVTDEEGESASLRVPFGKSEGSFEATYLPPDAAVKQCNEVLNRLLRGFDPQNQEVLDRKMLEADGTLQKQNLGGNSMLGVSVASCRLAAKQLKKPLFRHFSELFSGKTGGAQKPGPFPRILYNLVEGGVHSKNNVMFQEHLIIPKVNSLAQQIEILKQFSRSFEQELVKRGWDATAWGYEGGWAGNVVDDAVDPEGIERETMQFLDGVRLHNAFQVDFGIDAAANNIAKFQPEAACRLYAEFCSQLPFAYIEDPFRETGDELWYGKLFGKVHENTLIVGDDLTVTNPRKIKEYVGKGMINAVIVKPDQVGTLTEAFEAVRMARAAGWRVAVSHRSQETTDDYLADLAIGVGADFVKFGAFIQGERLAKYNRLLEIEE